MTDPMHDRCPALEPGTGERCVLYAKHVSDTTGVHVATGSWPVEPPPVTVEQAVGRMLASAVEEIKAALGVRPVEGSTPIASPAPRVGICGDSAPQIFPNTVPVVCSLPHGHAGWHHADGGGDWSERAPADEPAPVPPPVDALLVLLDKWLEEDVDDHTANGWAAIREDIETRARALWAAGVAEGHGLLDRAVVQEIEQRERAEEIADKLTAAIGRHLGVDFGEHSNLNDPWGRALVALAEADGGKFVKGAYEDGVEEGRRLLDETAATAAAHAYELGIAEGRRQATEERTEEKIRIDVSLDSPEYRRQLLKMIRNGQIVVRGGDHG